MTPEEMNGVGLWLVSLAIAILLLLLFRKVLWWYWGIDRIVAALESMDRHVKGELSFEEKALRDEAMAAGVEPGTAESLARGIRIKD